MRIIYVFIIYFDIEKYYVINFSNYLYLNYGEVNNFQFDLVPNGKLRLVYKNINCFDENDEMYVHYINNLDVPDNTTIPNPDLFTYYGCSVDISTTYNPEPVGRYEYYYHVSRSGTTTYYLDTITIIEGQEAEINIQH